MEQTTDVRGLLRIALALVAIAGLGVAAAAETAAGAADVSGEAPQAIAATTNRPSINGFYALELAYTYADPAHWSRAVNRLQLSAQGAATENLKYKIGARVDADPVYASSNFYLPDVKKDQRFDAIWGETYVDFSAGDWDFRLGAQNIVWGEVVGLFFADVVSARDMREFLLPSFDIIRIPQWAARAEYFAGDSHLELIWIPVQTFDRIGKPGADFYPFPLPSPTPQSVASSIAGIDTPARSLNNSSGGVRANTLLAGWDVGVFYYRSFSTSPTFYRVAPGSGESAVFQPRYDRIWQTGGTVTKDFGTFVMRSEAVYTHSQNFTSSDPSAAQGVVGRPTLDYIVTADVPFADDWHVNLQAFQRVYFGGEDAIIVKAGDFGVSALVSGKLTASLEPQLLWMQTFGGGGGLVRPRINWTPAKNTSLSFGFDIFTGPSDGYFGRYNNRDRVYSELRYDF